MISTKNKFLSTIKMLIVLSLLTIPCNLKAQINLQWESRFDNANAIDQARDMTIDASGNVYVTGDSFDGTSFNIVTVKYDNLGNELWVAEFDGVANGLDQVGGLDIDSNGDVFVTGFTYTGSGGDYDIVTIKYLGTNGNQDWIQFNTGSSNFDMGRDIIVNSLNEVIVVGQLEPTIGGNSMVTIKYSNNGTFQWSNTYSNGGGSFDAATNVIINDNNDIFMIGYSENGGDETDYLIRKYNNGGTVQWTQRYDNNGGPEQPRSAYFDNYTNNLLITGSTLTSVTNKDDYWTLSLNGNTGNLNWDMLYNGSGSDDDIASSIMTDTVGNVFVTGRSKGVGTNFDYLTIRYDVNGNEIWEERYQIPGNGLDAPTDIMVNEESEIFITGYSYNATTNNDYLTVKYDSTGNLEWFIKFDGPASDVDNALAMAIDPVGNIYVTGNSRGNGTNWDYSTIKYCQHKTEAGLDTNLCIGETVQLNAQADNGINFTWTMLSGDPVNVGTNFSCNPCDNPTVSPTQTSVYTVSSENGNGCVDIDTIEIVVNPLPGPSIYNDGPLSFCTGDSVTLWTDSTDTYTWSDGTNTIGTDSLITVYDSGTYTVTVEDEMGCQNTTNETITAFNLPNIDGGNDETICEGESTQVTASGGVSYDWVGHASISDTTIADPWMSPTTTQTYTVVGTDNNGCVDTGYVTINVNPEPTAPEITRVSCDTLSSNLVFGNQWVQNGFVLPGATNPTLTINVDGDYWIIYTDNNGCTVTSDTMYVRQYDDTCATVSTKEFLSNQNLNVYPNPTTNILHLEYNGEHPVQSISIINSTGAIVEEQEIKSKDFNKEIYLEKFGKGIYILRLITDKGILNKRVVVQ